jgi:hypothetical protein
VRRARAEKEYMILLEVFEFVVALFQDVLDWLWRRKRKEKHTGRRPVSSEE